MAQKICTMSQSQLQSLEALIAVYNQARLDIENFLEELKAEWQDTLDGEDAEFMDSQDGQDAQERISTLESWLDEVSTDFEPDLSVVTP